MGKGRRRLYTFAVAFLRAAKTALGLSSLAPPDAFPVLQPAAEAKIVKSWPNAAPSSLAARRRVLLSACLAAFFCLGAPAMAAQQLPPVGPPSTATAWYLQTNAEIDSQITVSDTLTLNAASGGSTINITSNLIGAHAFSRTTIGDIRINTNGNFIFDGRTAAGAAINNTVVTGSLFYASAANTSGNIFLGTNGTGDVTVQNFRTAHGFAPSNARGGAIYSHLGTILLT